MAKYLDYTGLEQVWAKIKEQDATLKTELNASISSNTTAITNEATRAKNVEATKVDKVEGKGLSTNDLTDTLLDKLNNIEEGATNVTKVSQLENDSDYQTGAEVSASIQAVVGSAPEALDTLKELADALGNDADFAATITKKITAVSTDLSAEVTRAKAAESTNASAISTETSRAKAAENILTTNLASEVTRAKAAEKTNADNIAKNTASIATNASGISTNASAIAALQTSLNDFVAITDSEIDAICK